MPKFRVTTIQTDRTALIYEVEATDADAAVDAYEADGVPVDGWEESEFIVDDVEEDS